MVSGRTVTIDCSRPEYAMKMYYKTNIPKLCTCGIMINHRQLYHHKQTKKHARLLSIIENPVPLGIK